MKNNIFLSFLIFSSSIQAAKIRYFKKYTTYLSVAALGGIATLLATQHKETRPYFREWLFPHYVETQRNLINQVAALNDLVENANNQLQASNQLLATANQTISDREQEVDSFQQQLNGLQLSNFQLQNRLTLSSMDAVEAKSLKNKIDVYEPLIKQLSSQLKIMQALYKSEANVGDLRLKFFNEKAAFLSQTAKLLRQEAQKNEETYRELIKIIDDLSKGQKLNSPEGIDTEDSQISQLLSELDDQMEE